MHIPRRHLNYANVVATLALVFAMSGGALAAKHYLINSTKQINPKVLKALKGMTGAPGSQGKEGPAGKEGPQGKEGKEGTKGASGATNVVVHLAEASTPNLSDGSARANCNPGERATGGGVELASGNSKDMWYFQPGGRPALSAHGEEPKDGETPTAWFASWYNESGQENTFRVYVICASP